MTTSSNRDSTPPRCRHEGVLNEARRSILNGLRGRTHPLSLGDPAAELDAYEGEVWSTHETPDRDHAKQVRIRLHHVDLPALAAAGFLEYDPDARLVSPPALSRDQ